MPLAILALIFAAAALLYASVGFGGGSTYLAVLAATETDYRIVPLVALACNIAVVSGGVYRFARAGMIPWRRALPLCAASVPMAWIGGSLTVSKVAFTGLLGGTLLIAAVVMVLPTPKLPAPLSAAATTSRPDAGPSQPAIGAALGLLSGIVGIGGGIFLAPFLHLTRWASTKAIAGTAALFILVNSVAGLAGQLGKLGSTGEIRAVTAYWPLLVAVIIGGQLGSIVGAGPLPEAVIRRVTAVLVSVVAIRLLWQAFQLGDAS